MIVILSLLLCICDAAPGNDAVRLGAFSFEEINQRIPNTCLTKEGEKCVFPFKYKGVEHHQCTYTDSPAPWCATAVDSSGNVITNSWGDCHTASTTSSCSSEDLGLVPCSTPRGQCVFPFRYKGAVYTSCTTVDRVSAWCSTATDNAGEHLEGSEGECPASCPVQGSLTTCTPGSSFTVDCNTCVCDSSGMSVCTTNTCTTSSTTTTSTTTTSTSTTTTTTTTSTTTQSSSSTCATVSGPDTGSDCIFPFTFNGVTYVACAEWVYGGSIQGQKWCSTKVDGSGVHVNGEGKYGFCSSSCSPTVSLAAILGGLGGVNINNAEITKTINNDNSKAKLQGASASFRRLKVSAP